MGHHTLFVNLTTRQWTFGPYIPGDSDYMDDLMALLRLGCWSIHDRIVYVNEVFNRDQLCVTISEEELGSCEYVYVPRGASTIGRDADCKLLDYATYAK